MDLSGQAEIKHTYVNDTETGLTTITFTDAADALLGSLTIETARFPRFMKALSDLARDAFDIEVQVRPRTVFDKTANIARSTYG